MCTFTYTAEFSQERNVLIGHFTTVHFNYGSEPQVTYTYVVCTKCVRLFARLAMPVRIYMHTRALMSRLHGYY